MDTEWESGSLLCSSKDGEDEKKREVRKQKEMPAVPDKRRYHKIKTWMYSSLLDVEGQMYRRGTFICVCVFECRGGSSSFIVFSVFRLVCWSQGLPLIRGPCRISWPRVILCDSALQNMLLSHCDGIAITTASLPCKHSKLFAICFLFVLKYVVSFYFPPSSSLGVLGPVMSWFGFLALPQAYFSSSLHHPIEEGLMLACFSSPPRTFQVSFLCFLLSSAFIF